ncbi:alpha/beta hydrolase [Haladaptatus sp. NG-SE-30]
MTSKSVTLEVGEYSYSGELNVASSATERGILVIPGAGHGPFGDIFDRFVEAASKSGHTIARFETWTSQEELAKKTDTEREEELTAGVEFLRSQGCSTIAIVAKSYGGRLALTRTPDGADRMVLWAPAILFGDAADAPSITATELADIALPVLILQGTEDKVVSVENAAALANHLPSGSVVELHGEDHSFLNDERRVIEETLAFLEG